MSLHAAGIRSSSPAKEANVWRTAEVRLISAAWVLALILRVGFVAFQNRTGAFDATFIAGDSALYLKIAHNILDGEGMSLDGVPTAFVGPVYPLYLALLLGAHLDVAAIELVQCLIGASTAVLTGLIARELVRETSFGNGRRLAIFGVAAFGAATYPHLIFWTGYILTETLFVALIALALWLLIRGLHSRGRLDVVACGFVFEIGRASCRERV